METNEGNMGVLHKISLILIIDSNYQVQEGLTWIKLFCELFFCECSVERKTQALIKISKEGGATSCLETGKTFHVFFEIF